MPTPDSRLRPLNQAPVRRGDFVLYWMTSFRRTRASFALERAVDLSLELGRPLVVLEALRVGYPHASDRLHAFILEGMADTRADAAGSRARWYSYVEPTPGAGKGLLEALAGRACVVVTDDWPCFFVPAMQQAAAARLEVRVEAVDANGLYPMRDTTRAFTTAHSFRAHLQKVLPPHLARVPVDEPLAGLTRSLPRGALKDVEARWPEVTAKELGDVDALVARLPIDHAVPRVPGFPGGQRAGAARLASFVGRLAGYAEGRNEPEQDATSRLSPYLHFGHVSMHQVWAAVAAAESWNPGRLGAPQGGSREGWWGLSGAAESFLDEAVTWRELAFNMAATRPEAYATLESLPDWARATHQKHARDVREHLYPREVLEAGRTHDPLWNAAQLQLVKEGWFHNYLRMLWGKKLLEWSPSPQAALETMEYLMNRYSLDGRDPVSYSGYLWVLGRYDRPWAPERPVFGTVRYMSSENTARKLSVKGYVERYTGRPLKAPRQAKLGLGEPWKG